MGNALTAPCCQTNQEQSNEQNLKRVFKERLAAAESLYHSQIEESFIQPGFAVRVKPSQSLVFPQPPRLLEQALISYGKPMDEGTNAERRFVLITGTGQRLYLQSSFQVARAGTGDCVITNESGSFYYQGKVYGWHITEGLLCTSEKFYTGILTTNLDGLTQVPPFVSGSGIIGDCNGNTYKGQFSAGLPNGEGSMNWSNGQSYKGTWKNGLRNGQGTHHDEKGIYTGGWIDDKRCGRAVFQDRANQRYDTTWEGDICVSRC